MKSNEQSTPKHRPSLGLHFVRRKAEKFNTPAEAVKYIQESPDEKEGRLIRIEVQIRLSSGEMIEGTFGTKDRAITFVKDRRF